MSLLSLPFLAVVLVRCDDEWSRLLLMSVSRVLQTGRESDRGAPHCALLILLYIYMGVS